MIRYKVIAGGYKHGIYEDEPSALQEATRLSYIHDKAIVRLIKGNGQPVQMADDRIIIQGTVTFKPKMYINGVNIAL